MKRHSSCDFLKHLFGEEVADKVPMSLTPYPVRVSGRLLVRRLRVESGLIEGTTLSPIFVTVCCNPQYIACKGF